MTKISIMVTTSAEVVIRKRKGKGPTDPSLEGQRGQGTLMIANPETITKTRTMIGGTREEAIREMAEKGGIMSLTKKTNTAATSTAQATARSNSKCKIATVEAVAAGMDRMTEGIVKTSTQITEQTMTVANRRTIMIGMKFKHLEEIQ